MHHNGYTEGEQRGKTAQETSLWHFLIPEHWSSQPPLIFLYDFLMKISFMERIGSTPEPSWPKSMACSGVPPSTLQRAQPHSSLHSWEKQGLQLGQILGRFEYKGQTRSNCNCPEDHGSAKLPQVFPGAAGSVFPNNVVCPNSGS